MLRLSNARFRKHVDVKPQGSVTLGFLDVDLVIPYEDHEIIVSLADMRLRLTTEGKPSLGAPQRSFVGSDGRERRSRGAYRFDDRTYQWVVRSVFALADVASAVEEAERTRAEERECATGTDDIPF